MERFCGMLGKFIADKGKVYPAATLKNRIVEQARLSHIDIRWNLGFHRGRRRAILQEDEDDLSECLLIPGLIPNSELIQSYNT